MSTSIAKKKLHESSGDYNELESSDSLTCVCIRGGLHKLQEKFGEWQKISSTNISSIDDVQLATNPHFVSPLFLSEYASTLSSTKTRERQSVRRCRGASRDNISYQFKHELSEDQYIATYRETKFLSFYQLGVTALQKSDKECSFCVSKKMWKDAINTDPTLTGYQRTIIFEPPSPYPALYGQIRARGEHEPGMPVIGTAHPLIPEDPVDRDHHWVPGNAVCRFHQPSRNHSVCCYDNDTITLQSVQGTSSKKTIQNMADGIDTSNKKGPTLTNLRTPSGRLIAVVQFKKSDLHNRSGKAFFRHDKGLKKSGINLKPINFDDSFEETSEETFSGKLLQGKLIASLNLQSSLSPELLVQSTSFKRFQVKSAEVHKSEEKIKAKLKPIKQDSVSAIPSPQKHLPDLEISPSSSQRGMMGYQKSGLGKEQAPPDKMYRPDTSPLVVKDPKPQTADAYPLSVLHSLSLRLKPTPSTPSYLHYTQISENSRNQRNPFLVPPTKSIQGNDLLCNSSPAYLNKIPYRHQMVCLRKLSKKSIEEKTDTASVETVPENLSRCALRSQQRRQRQTQRILSGYLSPPHKKLGTPDSVGPVCVKKPSHKVNVRKSYVRV